jgi:hypothetical protein
VSSALESAALGPGSQSTSSASRPFFAAQKWVASTATPVESCTTWVTPGTLFTFSVFIDFARPPKVGECATTAVLRSVRFMSSPNLAVPSIFSVESMRRVGLPISLKSFAGFNATLSGTGSLPAASASWP